MLDGPRRPLLVKGGAILVALIATFGLYRSFSGSPANDVRAGDDAGEADPDDPNRAGASGDAGDGTADGDPTSAAGNHDADGSATSGDQADGDDPSASGASSVAGDPPVDGASSRLPLEPDPIDGCTMYVANHGIDNADGRTPDTPIASPALAVDRSLPGEVVCFAQGVYKNTIGDRGALHIEDKHGRADAPITFRSLDSDKPAQFTMSGIYNGRSVSIVFIQRSSHIIIDGIEATNGFRGVTGNGVHHVTLRNSHVHHVGGELVYFGKRAGRTEPDASRNPISHDIVIERNELAFSAQIDDGGSRFGEGVYLGTSILESKDDTHTVLIADNIIHDVEDEAIDAKTGVHGVSIVNNEIYNVNVRSQGAITLAIHGKNWQPGNFEVWGNRISSITGRGSEAVGIWLGHGDAIVADNIIWDVADWGIYIPNTFNLPDDRDVLVAGNTVWNTGRSSVGWGRNWGSAPGEAPNLDLATTNHTWDGVGETTLIDACPQCTAPAPGE